MISTKGTLGVHLSLLPPHGLRCGTGDKTRASDFSHTHSRLFWVTPSPSSEGLFYALFLAEIAFAFFLASALDDAPQALSDNSNRVGLPLESRSGPRMLPIRARKLARLGLSPDLTGAFSVPPLYEARPFAFNPPFGFLPSLRVHAGDLATFLFLKPAGLTLHH